MEEQRTKKRDSGSCHTSQSSELRMEELKSDYSLASEIDREL